MTKSLPDNIRNDKEGRKEIEQAIKELINDGLLLAKPSTGEIHVSVNPRRITEIKQLLEL